MSDLGYRLRRHVEGASPAIDVRTVMVPRATGRPRFRRFAAAAVVVAVAGTAVVVAERLSSDDTPAEVGNGEPIEQADGDPWGWLDFGPESPDPVVPEGWQTLEYGPHRFSVPADWIAPRGGGCPQDASGVVLIADTELTCESPDTPPPGVIRIDDTYEFEVTGAESEQIRVTLTDAGRVRVLQDGPLADTTDWQEVEHNGIEFLVPPSWPVVDLPGTYRTEVLDDGRTSVSGHPDPGICGGALFPSTEVFLGVSPLHPFGCMRSFEGDLRPGLGVWARDVPSNADLLYTATARGIIDGATVEIIDMEIGHVADPLHVLITNNAQRTLVTLGVGIETSTARAILHSISVGESVDSSPTLTVPAVAACDDVDRFAERMRNPGPPVVIDYNLSTSPEQLRESASAVVRATLLGVREEPEANGSDSFAVFSARVEEVVKGELTAGEVIEVVGLVLFSSIEEHFTPGIDVVLFLDAEPSAGGWRPFAEGFWAGCDSRSASMLYQPVNWSHEGGLGHLLERTNGRIETEIGIDAAYRADDGTIVVTVTGYPWGYAPCRGAYQATASTAGDQLTIAATAVLDGDRSGVCAERGYTHALGVAGTADIDANELLDAASGERVPIADGIDDVRPSFYRDRPQLPDCGFIDLRQPDDEAAVAARQCFRDAYDSGDPAELGVLGYGEEGESGVEYFRIIDGRTYEVLVEQRPPVDNRDTHDGVWRWQRHECDSIYFLDPLDPAIANLPVLNYNGECRQVEES